MALNATTTHDTKRSEDVRLRINVLSKFPGSGEACLKRWRAWNAAKKRTVRGLAVPDANEEYFLYQTLLGPGRSLRGSCRSLKERLKAYVIKAAREAKVHTWWIDSDSEQWSALLAFVGCCPGGQQANPFVKDLWKFQSRSPLPGRCTPVPGAPQNYLTRSAGLLPGHGAVGLQPGGPGQPPAGGFLPAHPASH